MRCGLFGKLPAKRDFIAVVAPRALLDKWEPWMQSSISASRDDLDKDWQQAFLTAPIWRFWLGADICGTTVTGAFMSSLDGVGRYYPLTIFACADAGSPIPPPDIDAQDEWFTVSEQFLLSTLEKETAFETITAALERLAPPVCQPASLVGRHDTTEGWRSGRARCGQRFCRGVRRVAQRQSRQHLRSGKLLVDLGWQQLSTTGAVLPRHA